MLKYRPKTFAEVIGQKTTIDVLTGQFNQEKYSPSYLLHGPRGSGKTTVARIIAKALNCEKQPHLTSTPCNECSSCLSIMDGTNQDVIEIDGASNRGIDNVRDINKTTNYAPFGRCKVFIIDEAHMLTREAFNAFLKLLEEPPKNTVFILATTDFEALPMTVVSRCQKCLFKAIPIEMMEAQLLIVAQLEGIELSNETLRKVAQYANGSLRDGLSLLEQLSYLEREPTIADIVNLNGELPMSKMLNLIAMIAQGTVAGIFESINQLAKNGEDFKRVTAQLLKTTRGVLMYKALYMGTNNNKDLEGLAKNISLKKLVSLLTILNKYYILMQYGADLRVGLESALIEYLDTNNIIEG